MLSFQEQCLNHTAACPEERNTFPHHTLHRCQFHPGTQSWGHPPKLPDSATALTSQPFLCGTSFLKSLTSKSKSPVSELAGGARVTCVCASCKGHWGKIWGFILEMQSSYGSKFPKYKNMLLKGPAQHEQKWRVSATACLLAFLEDWVWKDLFFDLFFDFDASLLLHTGFLYTWSVGSSHCSGFSLSRAQALGAWDSFPLNMWNLTAIGIEPVSSAPAGSFLTTEPPRQPL